MRGRGSLHLQGRPPDKHEVSGGRPCKCKLPRLRVCKNDPLRGCSCKSEGGRARVSRSSPQGGEQGWGGRFRKNEPPGWSCCRNKSGGGRRSGQCAGGGVYISKMVDNERKWLAYLLALCMFLCLFLPTCPSCCIWLSMRSFCTHSHVFMLQPPIPFLPIPSPCSCGHCCC